MNNGHDGRVLGHDNLVNLIGKSTTRSFGYAVNHLETQLVQFFEVAGQRINDANLFWKWYRDLGSAPAWFKKDYARIMGYVTDTLIQKDPDLGTQINKYLASLNAGKKVVIVSHSQGNLYANNAVRYIRAHYPQYTDSIGIVGVATPSNVVENNGYYTTNSHDIVLNAVRLLFPNTKAPNVFIDTPTFSDHQFVSSYLAIPSYRTRIRNQVFDMISRLKTPEKDLECAEPAEVPIVIKTLPVTPLSTSTTRFSGEVVNGKLIDVYFVHKVGMNAPDCTSSANLYDGKGPWNKGDRFLGSAGLLNSGWFYTYRACGKREDGAIGVGNPVTFVQIFT